MYVVDAAGALLPPGALGAITAFVAALAEPGAQLTLLSILLQPPAGASAAGGGAGPLYVLVPVPLAAGARLTAGAGRAVGAFTRALAGCFPSTEAVHVPPPDADSGADAGGASIATAAAHGHGATPPAGTAAPDAAIGKVHALGNLAAAGAEVPALGAAAAALASAGCGAGYGACVVEVPCGPAAAGWVHLACTHSLARDPATGRPALFVPVKGALRAGASASSAAEPETAAATAASVSAAAAFARCDLHVYSVGTVRRYDWHGGGKTPIEMVEDLRHRFASGSFRVLRQPATSWEALRGSTTAPPAVRALFAGASAGATTSAAAHAGAAAAAEPATHHEGVAASAAPDAEAPRRPLERAGSHVSFTGAPSRSASGTHLPAAARLVPPGVADVLRLRKAVALPEDDMLLLLDDGVRHAEDEEDD
jgi:hypothetical protein